MLYTGKGDQGYTDLLGGRVPKYAPRPETFGTLDEATSAIGLARALAQDEKTKRILIRVQRDLYVMMAELAFAPGIEQEKYHITETHVRHLEETIDRLGAIVPIGRHFVLPGDTAQGRHSTSLAPSYDVPSAWSRDSIMTAKCTTNISWRT